MKSQKIYFYGIKGRGMSALANILKDLGNEVHGCDFSNYFFTEDILLKKGIIIDNIENCQIDESYDKVIVGNSFVKKFYDQNNKKHFKYVDALKNFEKSIQSEDILSIAVSGTHGKTTTTKMMTDCLNNVIGLIGDGKGIVKGKPTFFTYEACEYKNNFANYHPSIAVINNIEFDHPDYFKNLEEVINTFTNFAMQVKKYIIINGDDRNCQKLIDKIQDQKEIFTFGFNKNCDINARIISQENGNDYIVSLSEKVCQKFNIKQKKYEIKSNIYGDYMIYNSLPIILTILIENPNANNINDILNEYEPPKRRFNEENLNSNIIIDDYAHHPTALNVSINATRQKYPNKNLVLAFQPSYFSRTYALKNEFIDAFKKCDELILLDIHAPIGDEILENISSEILINEVGFGVIWNEKDPIKLKSKENNVIIVAGSGSVDQKIIPKIKEFLEV